MDRSRLSLHLRARRPEEDHNQSTSYGLTNGSRTSCPPACAARLILAEFALRAQADRMSTPAGLPRRGTPPCPRSDLSLINQFFVWSS
ncbi:MAG: hypothetical protein QOK48_3332 [Blastocatellia bacterium]|nr:hypothetical protein [Blastocatellia bacterium]